MNIEVKNLKKEFKNNLVFNDVNLTFETGKIYGIVGSNGAGKSVFLKILSGFYYPTKGEVLYDKTNYLSNNLFPPNLRALIEKPSFFPELTAFENLKILANIQNKITDKDITDMLELANLQNCSKKYYKFSAGMKQKLAIASVLMENPEIILLDAPFNAIDEITVKKIKNYINKIRKNKIIVISSHHKDDIIDLKANHIYKFGEQKVVEIFYD